MRPRLTVLLTGALAVAVATAVTGATVYRDRAGRRPDTGTTGESLPAGPEAREDRRSAPETDSARAGRAEAARPGADRAPGDAGGGAPDGTATGMGLGTARGMGLGTATDAGGGTATDASGGTGAPVGTGGGPGATTDRQAEVRDGGALRAWAELLRLPALCTVPGDALAGAVASGTRTNSRTVLAIASSVCLYEAGMALNDWADRAEDAVDRPHRPLPSGRIRPSAALAASGALTVAGLALATAAGRPARTVATGLAATIWAYDLVLKHTLAGPVAMAAARALDLLLGAAATGGRIRPALSSATTLGAHTLAVTAVSRHEAHGGATGVPLGALAVTAGVAQTVMGGRGSGLLRALHGGRSGGAASGTGSVAGAVAPPGTGSVAGRGSEYGARRGVGQSTAVRGAGQAAVGGSGRAAPGGPGQRAALWSPGSELPAGRREAASRGLPGPATGGAGGAPVSVADAVCTVLALGYAGTAGRGLLHAALNPSPQLTQRAVGAGIRATIPLQAALAARAGGTWTALGIAALAPAARTFARKVSVT